MYKLKNISKKELNEILKLHSMWLKGNLKGVQANLRLTQLGDVNLENKDLRYINFEASNLVGANLKNSCLFKANLKAANLKNANLENADLSCANLRFTTFRNANLKNVNFILAEIQSPDMHETGVLRFQFEKSEAIYTPCGILTIDSERLHVKKWLTYFIEFATKRNYTKFQIKMYKKFIKMCAFLHGEK